MTKYLLSFILYTLMLLSVAEAQVIGSSFISNREVFKFEKPLKRSKCLGSIAYPVLFSNLDNHTTATEINSAIYNFIRTYNVCNVKGKAPLVDYKIEQGLNDYLSVIWVAKIANKALRVDALTLNINTGKLLSLSDILSPLAKNFMPEIVKLSQKHLAVDTSWEQFLEKETQREVGFYLEKGKWYLVFNRTNKTRKNATIVTLPEYLLKSTKLN